MALCLSEVAIGMTGANSHGAFFGPFISQRGQTNPPTRDGSRTAVSLRPQPETGHVLVKADRLVRTTGEPNKAN